MISNFALIGGLAGALVQPLFSGVLFDRLGLRCFLVLVNTTAIASLCLLPTQRYAWQLAGLVVCILFQYSWSGLVLQYTLRCVPPALVGTSSGLTFAISGVAQIGAQYLVYPLSHAMRAPSARAELLYPLEVFGCTGVALGFGLSCALIRRRLPCEKHQPLRRSALRDISVNADAYSPYSPFPDERYMPDGLSTIGYEPFRDGAHGAHGAHGGSGAGGMRRSLFSQGDSGGGSEARRERGAAGGDGAAAGGYGFVGSTCVSRRAEAMHGARGGVRGPFAGLGGGGAGLSVGLSAGLGGGGGAWPGGSVAGDASPGMAAGLAVGNGIMERALHEAGQLEARGLMREASEVVANAMERMKVVQERTSASMRGARA